MTGQRKAKSRLNTPVMGVTMAMHKVHAWKDDWAPKKIALTLIDEIMRLRRVEQELRGRAAVRDFHSFRD